MKKIILASASPRRSDLLKKLNIDFEVVPSKFKEDMTLDLDVFGLSEYISIGKALDVAKTHTDNIIIAADTFVVCNGEILGKPKDREDSISMLTKISGNKISVISGYAILNSKTKESQTKSLESLITFEKLTKDRIEKYIDLEKPFDKSGSFSIQGIGSLNIKKIEGDYYNIIGLSLNTIAKMLNEFGVEIL